MQVRSGLVPLRLTEANDHRIGTNLLNELCADSLHCTVSVGWCHGGSHVSGEKTSPHVADGRRFVTLAEMETSPVFIVIPCFDM
jgi:hypothetical protein